ncbi:phage tail protein [Burkholderia multivorans]|uniref:phage tail protein n=1 Tax=Burkholderia multivorans TaxID=87883 RepID=UPI00123B39CB|nr:phage tail protein [Burkholderia multivorans]MBU9246607.1 phage tail protein [Burkholderia multivorans]MCA8249605.1 phage tail protein [Burkholderia multivorans]MCL4626531.1 phage tail protein [Burkholderia multivorans]MCO1361765.1 phage tail protein [Burkholderia multivorans]MCO1362290.1 phage tail protein [Burkholderia multivorans]
MMMALGLFVFSLSTLPYQELKRRRGWRYASNNRVGRKPARQYVGEDQETIVLSGVLLPELTGGDLSLSVLEAMADQHTAWPLIEGTGHIHGMFTIDNIDTTRTLFFPDGAARRIDFTVALTRNDDIDMLGIVTDAIKEAISL